MGQTRRIRLQAGGLFDVRLGLRGLPQFDVLAGAVAVEHGVVRRVRDGAGVHLDRRGVVALRGMGVAQGVQRPA